MPQDDIAGLLPSTKVHATPFWFFFLYIYFVTPSCQSDLPLVIFVFFYFVSSVIGNI